MPLSPRHAAFGDAIRAMRERRRLSQEELGDRADMSRNYLGDTERGERNISIRALWQIADGLGVNASTLLRETEKHMKSGK
jgi:transcriptional regulator with XRE-family HTH domain